MFIYVKKIININYNIFLVDDQLNWLHNSSDPWDMVEKYWTITRSNRLKSVLDPNSKDLLSISDYMTKFPALKKPAGYILVGILLHRIMLVR